ncbi:MAG: sensor histidine kinase, partial [Vitreimonas sp.]
LTACAERAAPGAVLVESLLVCPDSASADPARAGFDESACAPVTIREVDPQRRAIWLRARVVIPDELGDPLGVRVSAMASSAIYWNGQLLGENGRPATHGREEIAGLMDAEIFLPRGQIEADENLLAIRMSAQDMPVTVDRPVHLISIGPYGRLREAIRRAYEPALVASGVILLAAIFFFAAFLLDRREHAALWLSLLSILATAQLYAEASRGLLDYLYPQHVPRLIFILACAGLFAIALTAFIAARFSLKHPTRWIATASVCVLALAGLGQGFDGRTLGAIFAGAVVALAAIVRPAWRGAHGARVIAAALAVLVALFFWRGHKFLDQDFYLVVSALLGLLFVDQIFSMRRARDARDAALRRTKQLELELLRRGVAPHFLLNTLNSLAEWVEADPKTGVRMIEALGEHMRTLSQMGERQRVPLTQEIELVRAYLAVMSFRTDAACSLEVDGSPLDLAIPPGVLHTLAENGFSHNRYPAGGAFQLSIARQDQTVMLTFETPPADERRDHASTGAGHTYIRARLEAAFGGRASFDDSAAQTGSWRSVIVLPAERP